VVFMIFGREPVAPLGRYVSKNGGPLTFRSFGDSEER
jgi:hypothetical protein